MPNSVVEYIVENLGKNWGLATDLYALSTRLQKLISWFRYFSTANPQSPIQSTAIINNRYGQFNLGGGSGCTRFPLRQLELQNLIII